MECGPRQKIRGGFDGLGFAVDTFDMTLADTPIKRAGRKRGKGVKHSRKSGTSGRKAKMTAQAIHRWLDELSGISTKPGQPRRTKAAPARRLSNAKLQKLAAEHRPPQSWFDQTDVPFTPTKD
jgi:hypothetical protein